MSYEVSATGKTPALIIYLLDASGSMEEPLEGKPKIQHVNEAIKKLLRRMVKRSTKGTVVSPRYRIAMFAYSTAVTDIFGGIKTITEVAQRGAPQLSPTKLTDSSAAFQAAHDLLLAELPNMATHPAPMVCHLTDGAFTGADPEPLAQQIRQMSVPDGNVLVENIYVGPNLTRQPISDVKRWPGISSEGDLSDDYARKLFRMSSPIPRRYAELMREEEGYSIQSGAAMLFPASSGSLIELAFAMSGASPVT